MKNLEIARILHNIADILELKEVQWKPQAYRKAARAIETLPKDIEKILKENKLQEIPGVGEHIAKKIIEIIQTGKSKYYEQLRKEVKVDIEELRKVPGLGPKKIKTLYKKLKIKNIKDLQKVIKQNKIQRLEGFGDETAQNFQQGIELVKAQPKRFLYAQAVPIVEEIKTKLGDLKDVQKIEVAGSFRRGKETVGDLDFLIISKIPEVVTNAFISLPNVKKVLAKGATKSSVRLDSNIQVDLRIVKEKEFGSAMNYFIGSKQHNVELRKLCLKKGYSLSEYGLFKIQRSKNSAVGIKGGRTKGKWIAGRTEEEIYRKLGMQYVPPELRENMGEIQVALLKRLPKLIQERDIRGVFHNHSNWTDGSHNLLEMAQRAEEMKFKFISFNDHNTSIGIVNPVTERRLGAYLKEIEKVRKKVGIRVFSGLEIDILKNGSLALSGKRLKELDVVVASIHMSFKMKEAEMTKRICKAMENNPIHILGHPTTRLLQKRPPIKPNWEKVFCSAKEHNVFMEINTQPVRMDLSGELIKSAKEIGCKFALSPDAHSKDALEYYKLGVMNARRGWLEKKDLLNCWTLQRIEKVLRK